MDLISNVDELMDEVLLSSVVEACIREIEWSDCDAMHEAYSESIDALQRELQLPENHADATPPALVQMSSSLKSLSLIRDEAERAIDTHMMQHILMSASRYPRRSRTRASSSPSRLPPCYRSCWTSSSTNAQPRGRKRCLFAIHSRCSCNISGRRMTHISSLTDRGGWGVDGERGGRPCGGAEGALLRPSVG